MNIVVCSLIRILVLAAGLGGILAIVWVTADPSEGANIGAGLVAMALVVVTCGIWGVVDGRRHSMSEIAVCWSVVATVYALAWIVPFGIGVEGISVQDQITMLLSVIPFQFGQVLAPALIGALIGRSLGRPTSAPA